MPYAQSIPRMLDSRAGVSARQEGDHSPYTLRWMMDNAVGRRIDSVSSRDLLQMRAGGTIQHNDRLTMDRILESFDAADAAKNLASRRAWCAIDSVNIPRPSRPQKKLGPRLSSFSMNAQSPSPNTRARQCIPHTPPRATHDTTHTHSLSNPSAAISSLFARSDTLSEELEDDEVWRLDERLSVDVSGGRVAAAAGAGASVAVCG